MINRVVLVGRMVKEADLKFTTNGNAVATFTLAVNRQFNREETDFINCVVWKKPAENLANYTKKGSLIGLEGRIQVRNYDGQDGKKVYVTEVVADSVQFLEPKSNGNTNTSESKKESTTGQLNNDPFDRNSKTIDIDNSDLPF